MKSRWNRPNEYTEFWNGTLCKVYNYNMDTIKEMGKRRLDIARDLYLFL